MSRKNITTSIEADLNKKLKYLAVDTDNPLNELHEEAIEDLLKKYEKNRKKKSFGSMLLWIPEQIKRK